MPKQAAFDIEARAGEVVSVSAVHDETTIEFKTSMNRPANVDDQIDAYNFLFGQMVAQGSAMASVGVNMGTSQNTVSSRYPGKMAALGAAYGMGDMRQAENRIMRFNRTKDSMPYEVKHLSPEQERWARAFHAVLGVGPNFYVQTNRKAYLEAHYTEMATHDTPKGRKAAKVVAHRVMSALADQEPWMDMPNPLGRFNYQGSVTGRMSGNSFDRVIIDELTKFPRKKP